VKLADASFKLQRRIFRNISAGRFLMSGHSLKRLVYCHASATTLWFRS
jgi:hypothetical protein